MTSPSENDHSLARPENHLPRAEDFLLWPPNVQAYGYRMVDSLFASRAVLKSETPRPLKYGKRLALTYRSGGQSYTISDFMDRNAISGLIILKDGEVVTERYGLGLRDSDRWSTMSTVKSMTAMLVGAAVMDGAISSIDDRVTRYIPQLAGSAYDAVSVRHLMTMSSGVAWNEDYADKLSDVNRYSKSLADRVPGGVFKLMGELKQIHEPGARWHYNTGDTFLLGAVIRSATQKSLADYLREKVWLPCGMEFDAFYTLESEGGLEIGGSRAGIALRDFARLAFFVLQDGVIGGQRILPEGWVGAAGQMHFTFSDSDRAEMPLIVSGSIKGYGYSWWIGNDGAMIAVGFAGQRIYVNHQENIVMVSLGAFPQEKYCGPGDHDRLAEVVDFTDAVKSVLRG